MDRLTTKLQVKSFITKKIINEINRKIGLNYLLEKNNQELRRFTFDPTVPVNAGLNLDDPDDGNLYGEYVNKKSTLIPDASSLSWNQASDYAWKGQALAPVLQLIPNINKAGKIIDGVNVVGKFARGFGTWALPIGNIATQSIRAYKDPRLDALISAAMATLAVPFRSSTPLPKMSKSPPGGGGGGGSPATPTSVESKNLVVADIKPGSGGFITRESRAGKNLQRYFPGELATVLSHDIRTLPEGMLGHVRNKIGQGLLRLFRDNPNVKLRLGEPGSHDPSTKTEYPFRPASGVASEPVVPVEFEIAAGASRDPKSDPDLTGIANVGQTPASAILAGILSQWRRLGAHGQTVRAHHVTIHPGDRERFATASDKVSVLPVGDSYTVRDSRIGPKTKGVVNTAIGVGAFSPQLDQAGNWMGFGNPLLPSTPDLYSFMSNPISAGQGLSPVKKEDYELPFGIGSEQNPRYYIPKADMSDWDRLTWWRKSPYERLRTLKKSTAEELQQGEAGEIFTNPEMSMKYFKYQ